MCAYGRKWANVFLCPGRQRGQKALYLGQTSLHSDRAQSLFYLGFFLLPRGSGVNRCWHTPAWRGRPSPGSPAPAAAQPLPCYQAAALLKAPGFQQGGGRNWATRPSGDWGADLKSDHPSPTSCGAGGEEQGQLLAAPGRAGAAADRQMEMPPLSHLSGVRCRESPLARAAVLARWARPQPAGRPLRAELGQRSLSPGGHRGSGRSPASSSLVRLARLGLRWPRRCPLNLALQQACPAVLHRPRRCPLPIPWEADLPRPPPL